MTDHTDRTGPAESFGIETGATWQQWTRAGSTVVLERGVLQIDAAPLWLGERVVRPRVVLRSGALGAPNAPGAIWQADRTGWVAFTAIETARWVVRRPVAVRPRVWMDQIADLLDGAAQALRRRAGRTGRTMRAPHTSHVV